MNTVREASVLVMPLLPKGNAEGRVQELPRQPK
jgi:hypothetical protein